MSKLELGGNRSTRLIEAGVGVFDRVRIFRSATRQDVLDAVVNKAQILAAHDFSGEYITQIAIYGKSGAVISSVCDRMEQFKSAGLPTTECLYIMLNADNIQQVDVILEQAVKANEADLTAKGARDALNKSLHSLAQQTQQPVGTGIILTLYKLAEALTSSRIGS